MVTQVVVEVGAATVVEEARLKEDYAVRKIRIGNFQLALCYICISPFFIGIFLSFTITDATKPQNIIIHLILSCMVPIICILILKYMRKKYAIFTPDYLPDYHQQIPEALDPGVAATLIFTKSTKKKYHSGIYPAMLLCLARKNYIDIKKHNNKDILITINDLSQLQMTSIMPIEPLTKSEELFYKILKMHSANNKLLMSELPKKLSRDYMNTVAFYSELKDSFVDVGINKKYIQIREFTKLKDTLAFISKILFYIAIIYILITVLYPTDIGIARGAYIIWSFTCLFFSIYLKHTAGKYVLLTQNGLNEYAKWKGLYNYLRDKQNISNIDIATESMRERYFIYATAFMINTNYDFNLTNTYTHTKSLFHTGKKLARTLYKIEQLRKDEIRIDENRWRLNR